MNTVSLCDERSLVMVRVCTGTFFHLLEDTAHPSLSLSADGLTMFYLDEDLPISHMTFSDNTFNRSGGSGRGRTRRVSRQLRNAVSLAGV